MKNIKYLDHIVTSKLCDEEVNQQEMRSIFGRGNLLLQNFSFCSDEKKKSLCIELPATSCTAAVDEQDTA